MIQTTVIGAYPKPADVPVPDWFQEETTTERNPTEAYEAFLKQCPPDMEAAEAFRRGCPEDMTALLDNATREVVREQADLGIDVPTDGEVRRENYIYYHCRHLKGIDFTHLTEKAMRSGAWRVKVPTITDAVRSGDPFLVRDWRIAQTATDRPVKITLPGPLTLADSLADDYYGDEKQMGQDIADALNREIRELDQAGCPWIQVDEPLFARKPDAAIDYGIENLERCFHAISASCKRAVHICCGYPDRVDSEDYLKAEPETYFRLAPLLDAAEIDAVSIEDAHRPNDLSLLSLFHRSIVIFGVLAIARSRVETVDEIRHRLSQALDYIEPHRLMASPDCGLGMLDREIVRAKLGNMVEAVRLVNERKYPATAFIS